MDQTIDNPVIDEPTPAASGDEQSVETTTTPGETRPTDIQLGYEILIDAMIKAGSYPNDAPRQVNFLLDDLQNPNDELAAVLERSPRASDGFAAYVRAINGGIADGENSRQLFRTSEAWIAYRAISALVDELDAEELQQSPEEIAEHESTVVTAEVDVDEPQAADDDAGEPISNDELTRPRPVDWRERDTRNFFVDLTAERIAKLEHEKSNHVDKWIELEEEKAAISSELGGKIKAEKAKVLKLKATLDNGREEVAVSCQWCYDWTNGVKELIRLDTGDSIDTKRIPYDELERWREAQEPQLPFDEEAPAAPEPVKLFDQITCNLCHWVKVLDEPVAAVPEDWKCVSEDCPSTAFSLYGDPVESRTDPTPIESVEPTGDEVADQMGAIADSAHAADLAGIEGEVDDSGLLTPEAVDGDEDASADAPDGPQEAGEPSNDTEAGEEVSEAPAARKIGRPRRVA